MKKILLPLITVLILLVTSSFILAQSDGPNYPSTGSSISIGGNADWLTPTNILSDDASYSTSDIGKNKSSDYLTGTNFGFAIPGTATITGVIVEIDRYGGTTDISDNVLYLTKDGNITTGTDNGNTGVAWPTTATTATYGGSSDLWGTTWTPAEINSTNFGVMLMAQNTGSTSITAYVDFIRVTIHYTVPCTEPSTQASIGSFTNNTTSTSVTGNWTRGNGDNILVVARLTSTSAVAPSSGSSYVANTSFGSGNTTGAGNFVVYKGTGTTVDITNLSPETGYTFDIYEYNNTGICYLTTASSGAFTTPALSTPMPFTEDFESGFGSFSAINDATNYWITGANAGSTSGSNAAYITNDGSSYTYDNGTTSVSHIYVDLALPAGANPFNLEFSYKGQGESTYDYLRVYMTSLATTPVAGTSLGTTDQVGSSVYNLQSSWTTTNIELDAGTYAGNSWRLVFSWINDGSLGTTPPIALDDIEISLISCPTPSTLAASSITDTQAALSWTETGSATTWDIELGASGFTPTGTATQSGVTSNPYTYTSLSATTTYEFYVRADCGGSDYSSWAGPFEFTTACATYTPPFSEDFSSYLPSCWSETSGALAAPSTLSGTTSSWGNDGFANLSSTGSAKLNIYGTSADEWLITPSIDLGAGATDYQLEFDLALTDFGSTNAPDLTGTDDIFTVIISTDNGATWSSANTLRQWDNGGSSYVYNNISTTGERVIIDLTGYTGTVQFGFYGESLTSNADNDLFIDNVAIIEVPACPYPMSLTASSIDSNQANLGWTEGGSATTWDIELGASGFTPSGTPTQIGVTSNPYTYTGLSDNTSYEYYVRADCGGGDYSTWQGPYEFTTTCVPYTIPYFEGFESGYSHDGDVDGCLSQETVTGSAVWKINSTNTTYNRTPRTGSYNATLYYSNDDWIFIPINLTNGTNYEISLYARQDGATSTNADITIAYGNSPSAAAMTTTITSATGIINGSYQNILGYFSPSSTATYYVGILGSINGTPYYISIDDINIDVAPTCIDPSDLVSSNITSSSADLTWTASISAPADGYDIYYSTSTTPPDGATTPSFENQAGTTYTLSSLDHTSDYNVWLRADCSGGDVSEWIGPETFSTLCGVTSTFPWLEPFDSYLPNCWSEFEGTLATPTTVTTTSTSGWSEDGFANDGSTGAARINIYGTTCYDWLVTPSIDLGSGTPNYQIEFDLALTDYGNTDAPETVGTDDKFAVVISTDDGTTWSNANTLQEWNNTSTPAYSDISTTGEHIILDMTGYTGTVKIGFYGESLTSDADNDLSIDNVTITPIQNMAYVESTTSQITGTVAPGTTNQGIICVEIDMLGSLSPLNITDLNFDTNGTTATSDLNNATLWYTGTSSSFATTTQFGSVLASPNGAFSFTDSQQLSSGTNYFWLTYDISATAVNDNHVDAECSSVTIGSSYTPTLQAPTGYRVIGISYCEPAPTSVDNQGITNVTCGSINNTTGTETNNYGDYSAMTTNITQGATIPIDITFSTGYTYNTVIWIDWNKDGDFDDTDEEVYTGVSLSTNPTTLNAEFTVPISASLGLHRMRIGGADISIPTPCYTDSYASFEDYTVNIVAATPMTFGSCTVTQNNTDITAPNTYDQEIIGVEIVTTGALSPFDVSSFTFNITGSDAAADIANATLWTTGISGTFATTTQLGDVEVTPTGAFTISTGTNLPYTLSSGTNYFWLTYDISATATVNNVVDAVCTSVTIDGIAQSPTITDPAGNRLIDVVYCDPVYTNSCSADYISNVTFSTINNTTGCSSSSPSNSTLYTLPNPLLTQGISYALNVTTDGDTEGINVWIDWNHDGQFTSTESVLSGFTGLEPETYTTTVTIPGAAITGETRMRVRCGYNAAPSDACSSLSYGETEDYLITIIAGCAAPTITAISPTSSNICSGDDPGAYSLTISGGTAPYTYQWYKDDVLLAGETGATYSPGAMAANATIYCKAYSNGCAVDAQSPTANIYIDIPVATASVSETGTCSGSQISLNGGPTGMTSYSWTGPAGCSYTPDANSQSPTVTMGATSGSFTLTATNSNGCTASSTTNIVNVVPGAPSCSLTPSPADAAIDIEPGTTISWDVVAGATNYDVYFGAGSLPTTPSNMTGTTFAPVLSPNVEYHWKIVPKNSCGSASGCSEWTFTVAAPSCDGIAIDPTTEGGFESGPDFSDSFWWSTSTADAYANQFVCKTGATAGFSGSNCAYISNDYGAATPPHAYDNGRSSATHIFKDFAVPGGATNIKLDFNWIGNGESNRDMMKVWITPSYYTPVYDEEISASGIAPTGITQVGENNYSGQTSWISAATISIDDVYAGLNSVRIIFEWINDNNSSGADVPFAIDDVSITYTCPPPPCALGAIDFTGSSHTPVLNSAEGIYYIDMCQGETLSLAATMSGTPISNWLVNSYDGSGPERFTTNPLVYPVNYASGYDGSFVVNTGTCYSRIPFRIRSSSGPVIQNITATLEGCAGTSTPLDIGSPTSSDIIADPYCGDINLKLGEGITTYIPDGPYCPERCYESSVTFTDFPVNSTLQSEENLLYLKINMEHSNLANIQISLNGPNNCGSAIIVQDYYTYSQSVDAMDDYTYYWPYATTEVITFGIPYTKDLEVSGKPCNPTAALNYQGEGWDYCWSNNNDYSYASGYMYSTQNHSPIPANPYLDYSINPSDVDNQTNFYHPFESFSNLTGCPLNGTWTVKVCDSEVKSNGWIFNWEMALSSNLMPSYWDYQTSLDHATWALTSATTTPISEQSNPLEYDLTPNINSTSGTYTGTFTVYDDFGCDTTANISYDITGIPAIPGILTNDYVWTGDNTLNWDASTIQNWIYKDPTGFSNAGVIPDASTNVFVVDYCNLNNNPTINANVECNNLTILDGTLTVENGNTLTVSGNFDNQDVFIAENNSTVNLNGSIRQIIQSTSDLNLYDLVVSNSGLGIELQTNIIVSNELNMTSGNITTLANVLTLGTNTSNLGTLSRTDGIVVGNIRRWFDTSNVSNVLFPVGTQAYYRPAYISYTTAPTSGGTLTTSFNSADPGLNGLPLDDGGNIVVATAVEGYWPINAGDGLNGGTYDIDLSATGFGVIDYTQLWLLKRSDAASPWTLNGTHETATGSNDEPTVHRNGLSGFSEFSVGGKTGALPIDLLFFDASCMNDVVIIYWATASESNNDYFIIEKSLDLRNFKEVGKINGAGNSNIELQYSFKDQNHYESTSYYRLKQVDYDGTVHYFYPVSVNCGDNTILENNVSIYPNPFNSKFSILFTNLENNYVKLELIDEIGKLIYNQKVYIYDHSHKEDITLHYLKPGIYYFKIITDKEVFNIKVVKQ